MSERIGEILYDRSYKYKEYPPEMTIEMDVVKDKFLIDSEKYVRPKLETQDITEYESKSEKYVLEDWEKSIISQLHKTHPQLGGFFIINYVVSMIKKLGVINIAPMGQGKSLVGRTLKASLYDKVGMMSVDGGFTPAALAKRLEEDPAALEALRNGIVIVDDLTNFLATSDRTSLASFQMLSQLVEAGSYIGYVRGHPTIDEANISVIAAGTPICLRDFVELDQWSSHIQDRFLRLYWSYYNVPKENELIVASPKIPTIDMKPFVFRELPIGCDRELYRKCVLMLTTQFSERRAQVYTKKLLCGHAIASDRNEVVDKDCLWLLMYKPFITIESAFLARPNVVRAGGLWQTGKLVYGDAYPTVLYWCAMEPMDLDKLKINTKMPKTLLERILEQLISKKYIEKKDNKYFVAGQYKEDIKAFHEVFT